MSSGSSFATSVRTTPQSSEFSRTSFELKMGQRDESVAELYASVSGALQEIVNGLHELCALCKVPYETWLEFSSGKSLLPDASDTSTFFPETSRRDESKSQYLSDCRAHRKHFIGPLTHCLRLTMQLAMLKGNPNVRRRGLRKVREVALELLATMNETRGLSTDGLFPYFHPDLRTVGNRLRDVTEKHIMPVLTLQDILLESGSQIASESFRESQETANGKGKLRSVARLMEWSDTDTVALRERLGELPSWLADYTERMNEYQRKLTQKMFSGRPEIPSRLQTIIPGLIESPQNPLVVFPVMAPHPPPVSSYSAEGEWDVTRYVPGIWDLPEVPDVPPDGAFVSTRWISTTLEGEEGYFAHPPIPYLPPHAFFVKRIVDGREVWVPETEWPGQDYTSLLSAPADFRGRLHPGSSGALEGSLSSSTMRAIRDYMQRRQLPGDYRLKQLVLRYTGEGPASTAAFEAVQDFLKTGRLPSDPRLKDVVLRYLEAGPEAISTVTALRDYIQSGTLPDDEETAAMIRTYEEKGLLPRRWEELIQEYTFGETSTLTPTLLLTRTFVDGYEVYIETGTMPSKLPSRFPGGSYSVTETLMQLPRKYGEVVWVSRRIAGKEVLLPAKLPAGASAWEAEQERGPDGRFLSDGLLEGSEQERGPDGRFLSDGPLEGFYPDGRSRPLTESISIRDVVIWPPDEFGDYLRGLQLGDYPSSAISGEVARTVSKRGEDVLFGQYVVIWPPEEYIIGESGSAYTGVRSARSTRHRELLARLGEGALSGRYVVIWPPEETRQRDVRSVWGLDEEEEPTAWRVTIWPPSWREATGIDLSQRFDLRERMAEHARNVVIPVCFTDEIVDDTCVSVAELGYEEPVRPDCVVHEVETVDFDVQKVDFDVRNVDFSNDPVKIVYHRNRDSASLQSDGDDGVHQLGDYDEYEVIEAACPSDEVIEAAGPSDEVIEAACPSDDVIEAACPSEE